jgi:hypothetical protein
MTGACFWCKNKTKQKINKQNQNQPNQQKHKKPKVMVRKHAQLITSPHFDLPPPNMMAFVCSAEYSGVTYIYSHYLIKCWFNLILKVKLL